jgi:hypothetical protein
MRLPVALRTAGLMTALLIATIRHGVADPAVTARFECAVSHSYTGFGLNVWPLPGRLPAMLNLLPQLSVNFARPPLLPFVDKEDVPEGLSFDGLLNWLEGLARKQQELAPDGGFSVFHRLQTLGIALVPASWGIPRNWGQDRQSGPMRHIQDGRVDDYGRLLAAGVALLAKHGIRLHAIELLNEPVGKISPPQYTRLIQSFRSWQSRSGVGPTPVAGPGTAFTVGNARYLQAGEEQGIRPDIISTHAYDPTKTRELPSVQSLVSESARGGRKPLFVTEYGIVPKAWFDREGANDLPAYAVLTAGETLALYSTGANTVFYWQAQAVPWRKGDMALLGQQDAPRLAIGALRTVVQALTPGDRIAAPEPRKPPLPILLVVRPSELILQIANPIGEAQEFAIETRNCTARSSPVTRTATWPADRAVTVTVQPEAPGRLQVRVPAETVVSLTLPR